MTSTTPVTKPFLSNVAYDRLKFIAQILLPALGTLYFGIAALWGLPKATEVIGTITAIDVFLGILLGLSTSSYNKSDLASDGELVVDTQDPLKDTYSLVVSTTLAELETKKAITLKVRTPSQYNL